MTMAISLSQPMYLYLMTRGHHGPDDPPAQFHRRALVPRAIVPRMMDPGLVQRI